MPISRAMEDSIRKILQIITTQLNEMKVSYEQIKATQEQMSAEQQKIESRQEGMKTNTAINNARNEIRTVGKDKWKTAGDGNGNERY